MDRRDLNTCIDISVSPLDQNEGTEFDRLSFSLAINSFRLSHLLSKLLTFSRRVLFFICYFSLFSGHFISLMSVMVSCFCFYFLHATFLSILPFTSRHFLLSSSSWLTARSR